MLTFWLPAWQPRLKVCERAHPNAAVVIALALSVVAYSQPRAAFRDAGAAPLPTESAATSVAPQVDQERARAYFAEAAVLCKREGGRIWGVSLCGPMVFADPATGTIATNQPAPEGPHPRALGFANSALSWGGVRWSTFVWPLIAADEVLRARLMMHELFHRIQPELGLLITNIARDNDHLDTVDGRYWQQLEWRALRRALGASGNGRLDAVRDALAFRSARRGSFEWAAESERAVEINEGLAQYTATVAAAASRGEAIGDALAQLEKAEQAESFVRTFAYASGAAYGLLLDESLEGWTRRIRATDDLASLLARAADLDPSTDVEVSARRYRGTELRAAEEERNVAREARLARLRARFVEGAVFVVPRGRNATYVTAGVTPLPGAGTVYPSFRVTGEWGSVEAAQILMSPDGARLSLPAPFSTDGSTITGDGWKVTLSPGWVVRPGPRPGDSQVVPTAPKILQAPRSPK